MTKSTSLIAVLAACGLIGSQGIVFGQQREGGVKVRAGQGGVSVNINAEGQSANRGDAARGISHRATEIQDMAVTNADGEELGTVKDIVIDVRAGKVKYAALSYGGVLGLGDKLFAVPWSLFEHRHDASNDSHKLVLNISKERLANAPGFDQDKWPNLADPSFHRATEKYYEETKVQHGDQAREGKAGVNVETARGNVEVAVNIQRNRDRTSTDADNSKTARDVVHRASKILGMPVKNAEGKDLGSVNDLVIDMDTGRIRYAALSYGGFLGLGDKLFAVPWKSFDCQYDTSDSKYFLVLAVDEVTLRKAPGFDQNNWPNLADPKFGTEIDDYYNASKSVDDRPIRPRQDTERE